MHDFPKGDVRDVSESGKLTIQSQRFPLRQFICTIVLLLAGLISVAGDEQTASSKCAAAVRTTPDEESVNASGRATASTTRQKSTHDKYTAFGAMQVFTTKSALWIFLDIDTHEQRGDYVEPPSTRTPNEFRAYRIDAAGIVEEWRSRLRDVRAHPNLSAIFRHQGETFVYSLDTHHCFKLVSKKEGHGVLAPASLPAMNGGTESDDATSRTLPDATIEKANEREGFKKLGYTNYGYGTIPTDEVAAEKLGIRMRLHARNHCLGWASLSIEYAATGEQKTKVLLDLRMK
jgi:hypothetical protein